MTRRLLLLLEITSSSSSSIWGYRIHIGEGVESIFQEGSEVRIAREDDLSNILDELRY